MLLKEIFGVIKEVLVAFEYLSAILTENKIGY